MNKRERIHRALVLAKAHLSKTYSIGSKEQFICFALYKTVGFGRSTYGDYLLAKEMVMERLGHFNCVEDWLRTEGVGFKSYYAAKEKDQDVVQKYRHRWLDALIEEFSKPA